MADKIFSSEWNKDSGSWVRNTEVGDFSLSSAISNSLGSFSNDDGDGKRERQKSNMLNYQNNNSAGNTFWYLIFCAVTVSRT